MGRGWVAGGSRAGLNGNNKSHDLADPVHQRAQGFHKPFGPLTLIFLLLFAPLFLNLQRGLEYVTHM